MKRLFLLLSFVMMCVCAVMAQAPEKMTYQAVVRNSGNSLVANQNVSVRLSILQGSVQGAPVYVENHTAATNDNGLMTVVIGGGAPTTGVFANIDWANGPYFLKSEIDPTGGINYSIESVQQLMSVPYALYAKEAGNGFSGDYNDLTNRPQIPQVPTNVSSFTNDAGYITMDSVPVIPTVPTNVSAFTNDAGYLTSFTESQILTISNDTIYLTGGSFVKLPAGFDGDYNSLTNKPNLAPVATTGLYNDITGKPNLAPVATSGEYNDLTGKPNLAPVATSGDYNDLTNRPQIPQVPTNVSAFTNDAGYITMDSVPAIPTVPTNVSAFTNDAGYLTSFTESQILSISNDTIYLTGGSFVKLPAGFDGDYNSLTNKPNLAPVATTGSYNDITGKPNLAPVATSGEYNDLTGKPNLAPVATSGNYNDLTNRPQIPQVPTNVSAFTNDAGYITMDSIPAIPTVPTNVSAFTNDAGYITQAAVPTNVSQLQNDAGYITRDSIPAGLAGSQTGDIMYWDAGTNTWIMMPAGTSGQVLTMENGVPRWASLPDYVTMNLPPTVTTTVPSEVTQSSVLCGGVVTSDGSVQLTACGVCWSTHHFPTIADAHTENDLGVSAFTSHVSNLAHHTTYYVRAYATNSVGTSYGAEMTFTTTDIPTDSLMMPNPCSSTDTNAVAQPTLGPNYLICAGTDSVELSLGNYQYGSIQWQYSLDTISWFDIPNAFDEQLVYKPEQTQFVRAEVSYANCPPEHSEVKLLQKTPAANAGISRTANIGDTLHLQANMEENATGSWQILQGANGLLKTPTEAASKFYGTDSLYRLRWTLTNSCGTSSDDINVRYVRPKVSSKVVVVDTTDIIFSDSAQLAHGYYVISFSDSNIVIGDSTILVSIVNGGFLRKVDSWSMANDSTYAMYTTQASLSDLLESGVINFGGVSNGDNEGGDTVENAVENTPAQNTPRNAPMQNTSSVQNIEFLDHIPTRKELREHPEMNGKMYVMRKEAGNADGSNGNGNITNRGASQERSPGDSYQAHFNGIDFADNPGITFKNLKIWFDEPKVEYDKDHRLLKYGFYNANFKLTGDLIITPSANGSVNDEYIGERGGNYSFWDGNEATIIIDNVPFEYKVLYFNKMVLKGSVAVLDTVCHSFEITKSFTRGVHYDVSTKKYTVDTTKMMSHEYSDIKLLSYNGVGTVNLNVSLETHIDINCFNTQGLSSQIDHKTKFRYCHNQEGNKGWNGTVSSDLEVKLDLNNAQVFDAGINGNWSGNWTVLSAKRAYPKCVYGAIGDRQEINADGTLSSPVGTVVLGSDGRKIPNARVYFRPQNGGSVSDTLVYTNDRGVAETQWTPGLNGGPHYLYAYVYDCNQQQIEDSPIRFSAYERESATQTNTCANSTLQLRIHTRNDGRLVLAPQNGAAPYTYSMDGNNIAEESAYVGADDSYWLINMPTSGTHVFVVTDSNGCTCSKAYTVEGTVDCSSTNLGLNKQITDRTIKVQGRNGRSPYQYALDGRPYSDNNVFTSLSAGTYTVHVKDDNGCEVSEQVEVVVDNTSSQSATPCAGAETVTDVDGNVYPTLKIGTQCWMAENLRTTRYANGDAVPILYPNDSADLKSKYGLLYTWNTATGAISSGTNPSGVQGICPDGWHIPSLAEWEQLLNQPQLMDSPAKPLATRYGWMESNIVGSPGYRPYRNNDIGFNAAPAGVNFSDFGVAAWFWSAFGTDAIRARGYCFGYDRAGVLRHDDFRSRAYSVRCLRD